MTPMTENHLLEICKHVVNGGSILEKCEEWGMSFSDVWAWMDESRDRVNRYERAVKAQNEWAIVRILRELKLLAFSDHRAMYDDKRRLKHPTEWSKEVGAVIQGYKITEYFEGVGKDKEQVGWTTDVKMYDKQKAIEMYGKYLKLFGDRVSDGGLTLEDLVEASSSKVERRVGVMN